MADTTSLKLCDPAGLAGWNVSRPIVANEAGDVETTAPGKPSQMERHVPVSADIPVPDSGCQKSSRQTSSTVKGAPKTGGERADASARPGSKHRHKSGKSRKSRTHSGTSRRPRVYAALDLGTNNCRLLVANPNRHAGFRVIDAFSRIVRLGEGLSHTGCLSDDAETRAISALKICTDKMIRRGVERSRLIATEACRSARNGDAFIARVKRETGLKIEIINRKTEAQLAVAGCAALLCPESQRALVFDIGGGSSEIMWLAHKGCDYEILSWTSVPVGVVTLAEKFGGVQVTTAEFARMVDYVMPYLQKFEDEFQISCELKRHNAHMLGTSGTVTTIAGIHLDLPRYDRSRVDGCWLSGEDVSAVNKRLLDMPFEARKECPCVGADRADLVLAGCAILEAVRLQWPCERVRVADRGLREGILTTLMRQDETFGMDCDHRSGNHRRGPFRRRAGHSGRSRNNKPKQSN